MQYCCMQCLLCIIRLYNRIVYSKIPSKKKVSSSHLPWLWIGVETMDGSILTHTEVIDEIVEYGDCVTPELLESLTDVRNVKRWIYLDSKTLKEKEIPAEGLIIEDDSHE